MGGEESEDRKQRKEQERQYEKSFGEDVRRFDLSRALKLGQIERGKLSGRRGEEQFLGETAEQLPELKELQSQILLGATPAQGMADKRTALALRESGVRGPEAGLERSRQSGILNRDLQRMLSEYSLREAEGRRGKRSSFFEKKALSGQQATF